VKLKVVSACAAAVRDSNIAAQARNKKRCMIMGLSGTEAPDPWGQRSS
jgi:hypothetical protein